MVPPTALGSTTVSLTVMVPLAQELQPSIIASESNERPTITTTIRRRAASRSASAVRIRKLSKAPGLNDPRPS
jgi:hypothetical protein